MTGNTIARAQAEQQAKPTLVQVVQMMQPEIARALPKGMDADRVARIALTVLRKDAQRTDSGPRLADCTAESFAGALLTSAALGLEPGLNGESHLVPHRNRKAGTVECTLIIGYPGMAKLYYQHPQAKFLDAQAVYEHDTFDYAYGLDPFLIHKPALGERGKVIAYYAVAVLKSGGKHFVVLSPEQVKLIRQGKEGTQGDIPDPMRWMERKTALRQLFKLVPKSTQLLQALAADERTGTELAAEKIPEAISAGELAAIPHEDMPDDVDPVTGEVKLAPEPWSDADLQGGKT